MYKKILVTLENGRADASLLPHVASMAALTSAAGLRAQGLRVETRLALGNPPAEIVRMAESEHCDLIAMASHGHRLLGDIIHGSTIDKVRHDTAVTLLVVRAAKQASA